jgi:hypothetical protein
VRKFRVWLGIALRIETAYRAELIEERRYRENLEIEFNLVKNRLTELEAGPASHRR